MEKIKKIFLPKWTRRFFPSLFFILWLFITWLEFFSSESKNELGPVGYIIFSVFLLGITVMMWLMGTGRLPAYIIKEEEDKE